MKKFVSMLLMLAITYGAYADNVTGETEGHKFSTMQTITYVVIAAILLTVIFSVLWRNQKRKFNE